MNFPKGCVLLVHPVYLNQSVVRICPAQCVLFMFKHSMHLTE